MEKNWWKTFSCPPLTKGQEGGPTTSDHKTPGEPATATGTELSPPHSSRFLQDSIGSWGTTCDLFRGNPGPNLRESRIYTQILSTLNFPFSGLNISFYLYSEVLTIRPGTMKKVQEAIIRTKSDLVPYRQHVAFRRHVRNQIENNWSQKSCSGNLIKIILQTIKRAMQLGPKCNEKSHCLCFQIRLIV